MGRISNTIHGLMPATVMVAVQVIMTGMNIFYKLAANDGMSMRILIAYRFLFAAAFLVPVALIVERKRRPKLTWVVACQAFLCGLLMGSLAQNLYAESLVLSSATFVAAMFNLVPAITFILAICFGLERLGLGTTAGKAKVAGTLVCIGGAMLLTFYKGAEINLWSTNVDFLHKGDHQGGHVATSQHQEAGNQLLGALLIVCCCFSVAMGYIVQAKMLRNYPYPYSSSAVMTSMGAIQAVAFALCTERDWSQWKLGWNIRLLVVSFMGIVASAVPFTLVGWCVQKRGPLYVSVFSPLMLILVAIMGFLVLNEKLHLGSVLGGVVVVCGLYMVLWGKGKELQKISQLMPSKSSRESEQTEIISTSSAENNNNTSNGNISVLYDDASAKEGGGGEGGSGKHSINV